MTEDHDWVARLLAASGPATMPEDVAARLTRALQAEAERAPSGADADDGTPVPDAPGSAPVTTVTPPGPADRVTPVVPGAGEVPAGQPAASARRAATGPVKGPDGADSTDGSPVTAPDPAAGRAATRTGASSVGAAAGTGPVPAVPPTSTPAAGVTPSPVPSTLVPPAAGPPGAVPPSAVPPVATTGSLPRLRSVPAGDDGPAAPSGAVTTGSRARGSRRELREEDQGERRRRALTRWAPVAAGVLVLGGAAAVVGTQLGGGDTETSAADRAAEVAVGAAEAAQPSVLVASGTQYSTADRTVLDTQIRDLVALAATDEGASTLSQEAAPASGDDAAGGAAEDEGADTPTVPAAPSEVPLPAGARSAAQDSPLADPQRLSECIEEVTAGTSSTAAAVDLAVVDGVESTVLVVPDAAGLTYQVYVVGPDCSAIDTRFQFLTVTP